MSTVAVKERIGFIDLARFYTMALVFYGHFIEEFMLLKNPIGAAHYKFIYSFHMVLFVLLAGYVAKTRDTEWRFGRFLKHRFITRLLPFLFFYTMMMIPPVFFEGKFWGLEVPSTAGYITAWKNAIFGLPTLCVPSWFLLMIIGIELVHYTAFRFLKDSTTKILIAAVFFYVVGYWFNLKVDVFNVLKGRTVGYNYFFIHEAITLYSFYLIGIVVRRNQAIWDKLSTMMNAPAAVLCFAVVFFTYALNTGPFNFHIYNSVVIIFASHGHFILFAMTALTGCAGVMFLSNVTPQNKLLNWLGQNTLILMCLNGIFYHFTNPPLARWILEQTSGSAIIVFVTGIITTIVSLALCIPFIYILNRFVPFLVGKPHKAKPVLTEVVTA